jgi:hypothetical protein
VIKTTASGPTNDRTIKVDYKVALGYDHTDFEEQVNIILNQGYIPVGGVFVLVSNGEM